MRTVFCTKLQKNAPGLDNPPFANELGNKIYQQISKEAWQMWQNHQTLLINEHQLSLIDPSAKEFLYTEMEKFLFGEGSEKPKGWQS